MLYLSPLLFQWAYGGKFELGESVFPLTVMYCVWTCLAIFGTNYLWCAERARWCSLALIAGLVTNVVLNRILLPQFGLAGAVTATAAANALALVVLLTLMNRLGLRRDPRVWLVCALPLALCLGPQCLNRCA